MVTCRVYFTACCARKVSITGNGQLFAKQHAVIAPAHWVALCGLWLSVVRVPYANDGNLDGRRTDG